MATRTFTSPDADLWSFLGDLPANAVFVTPTDTVYGFSARHGQSEAADRITRLKGRGDARFITLISSETLLHQLADVSPAQLTILQSYWPGPITFVLRKKGAQGETVALRWPKSEFLAQLIARCGGALLSTSCNRHGEPTVTTVQEAQAQFGDGVDFYIDGGTRRAGLPSTLVDLTDATPRVLRQGDLSFS